MSTRAWETHAYFMVGPLYCDLSEHDLIIGERLDNFQQPVQIHHAFPSREELLVSGYKHREKEDLRSWLRQSKIDVKNGLAFVNGSQVALHGTKDGAASSALTTSTR